MDVASVPQWAWIAVVVVAVLLLGVAGYCGARAAYRRISRRYLVQVIGRREGVLASRRTLEAVIRHLADEDERKLAYFAAHPEDVDRKALLEIARRMEIATEELDTMPLPRSLWPAASALADAAYVMAEEAGRVGESDDPEEVLTALAVIDISRASSAYDAAQARVQEAAERFELDEAAVYGGGLYI